MICPGRARPLRCGSVPRPPLLLLPPSEGKAHGGRRPGRPDAFAEELRLPRAAVLAELSDVLGSRTRPPPEAVFGVRGELLERAVAATADLVAGTAAVLPAWRRYSGVVWAGLEPATLTPADRRRILVPSGLYGLTTAADPVADYRLKLLVSLGRLGRLSTFWRPFVTAVAGRPGPRTGGGRPAAGRARPRVRPGGARPRHPGRPGPLPERRRAAGRRPRGQIGQGSVGPGRWSTGVSMRSATSATRDGGPIVQGDVVSVVAPER